MSLLERACALQLRQPTKRLEQRLLDLLDFEIWGLEFSELIDLDEHVFAIEMALAEVKLFLRFVEEHQGLIKQKIPSKNEATLEIVPMNDSIGGRGPALRQIGWRLALSFSGFAHCGSHFKGLQSQHGTDSLRKLVTAGLADMHF